MGVTMNQYRISKPMRLFLMVSATFQWIGIALTGLTTVHWVLYVPAVMFILAVITGICPGWIISNWLVGKAAKTQ
jgi:hypothetical protein